MKKQVPEVEPTITEVIPNNARVEAISHKDVRGKELLYCKISYGKKEVLINIGASTFNTIRDLLTQ